MFGRLWPLFREHKDDYLVLFSTNTSSNKVTHIEANPKICAYYCDPQDYRGLTLIGDAEIVEDLEVKLPVVVTVVKQTNDPRHPSMRNVLKAKRAEITKWTLADLDADPTQAGFDGSPTQVIRVWPPEKRSGGKKLEGSVEEVADELAAAIKEMSLEG